MLDGVRVRKEKKLLVEGVRSSEVAKMLSSEFAEFEQVLA